MVILLLSSESVGCGQDQMNAKTNNMFDDQFGVRMSIF